MRQKIELKAALDALQVRKPLRLPSATPSFTPPTTPTQVGRETPVGNPTPVDKLTQVGKTTPVGKSTPVANPTQVENATEVGKETPVAKPTQVAEQTPVVNPAQVENPTPVDSKTRVGKATLIENKTPVVIPAAVRNHTRVPNPTPVENATPVAKPTEADAVAPRAEGESAVLTRRATEQDSSVVLEARAIEGLERGYTRLPNNVLMRLASGDFTRNEIKLALLIARFTISFQRKSAPLSKTVLARRAELREPAVLEAISGLVSKGLVEKQQGDQNRPNMLGLVLPPDWDTLTRAKREGDVTPVRNATPVVNPTPFEIVTSVADTTPAPVEKSTPAGVGNPTYFKDIKIYKKYSLSELPVPLQKYFGELKPAKKRESEWRAFESLQGDYPIEDISACLALLQDRGIKRRGPNGDESQPCHSPMSYLSKAMGEIFGEVEVARRKARERIQRERRDAEVAREFEATSAREAVEWSAKERAFVEALLIARGVMYRPCFNKPKSSACARVGLPCEELYTSRYGVSSVPAPRARSYGASLPSWAGLTQRFPTSFRDSFDGRARSTIRSPNSS